MKKDQNLPNKNVYSNISSGKPLPNNQNYSRNQSPHNSNYRGSTPEQRNSRNFSQNRYSRSIVETTIHDQIQTRHNNNHQITNQIETEAIQIINHETRLIIEIDTIQILEIEIIRIIGIEVIPTTVIIIQTIDHEITHTTDRTITDQTTINTIDQEIIHKNEILVIIIDTEIIHNHHTEIIIIITILNIDIEAIPQNTKDK